MAPDAPRIVSANLTWVAGLLLTGFTILKIVAVAHFDPTTALIIVNSSSAGTVVIGALTLLLPAIVYVGFFLSIVGADAAEDTTERAILYGLSGLTGLIFLLVWPMWIALLALFVGGLVLGLWPLNIFYEKFLQPRFLDEPEEPQEPREIRMLRAESAEIERKQSAGEKVDEDLKRFAKLYAESETAIEAWGGQLEASRSRLEALRGRLQQARNRTKRFLLGAVVWVFITSLPVVLADTPWLPKEKLERADQVIVGYVLGADAASILLLRQQDRTVIRLASTGWSREYCKADSSPYGGSLLLALHKGGTAVYPPCP